ncbi:MAG TPA: helix-turn-helix domain-containing protein [Polyangiaceae bacterium]|jgi:transcriptional regulator GlxA family with amidase domain|nr:helix-turn-helix domain-containing protein [Polyangiaceae bacterium]
MPPCSKRIWFALVPGTGLLNIAGPWEVLGHTNDVLGFAAYELAIMGPRGPTTVTGHGLTLSGVRPLPRSLPKPPDVLVIAGAPVRRSPEITHELVSWVVRHQAHIPCIVSICTGAFVLGAAGLLDGKRATTHWIYLDEMRARFPKTQVVDEGIFVRDGRIWTSAGVTAGIDLTLALVERDHGHEVAMTVAKRLVLFLRRSGNQAQFSGALQRQEQEPPELRDLSGFVLEHLAEPLSVQRLAKAQGMSSRSLTRLCSQHFGESPAALVRRLRIDEARRLLEETTLSLKQISAQAGIGDESTFWRLFTRRLGVTPALYRERFRAKSAD